MTRFTEGVSDGAEQAKCEMQGVRVNCNRYAIGQYDRDVDGDRMYRDYVHGFEGGKAGVLSGAAVKRDVNLLLVDDSGKVIVKWENGDYPVVAPEYLEKLRA